jgi:hypothetical protein
MKTNITIIRSALCGLVSLTALTSCTVPQTAATQGTSPITWTTKGTPSGKMDVLYVQNSRSVSLSNGKLVLRGVNSKTICFTDRPARLAGHLLTKDFIPLWSEGKDSFLKDPPNATLSIFSGNKVSDVVVEISNPVLSGGNLTYNAKVLEGPNSISGGESTLFIDIIGCPRTPYSYAGAARRRY